MLWAERKLCSKSELSQCIEREQYPINADIDCKLIVNIRSDKLLTSQSRFKLKAFLIWPSRYSSCKYRQDKKAAKGMGFKA